MPTQPRRRLPRRIARRLVREFRSLPLSARDRTASRARRAAGRTATDVPLAPPEAVRNGAVETFTVAQVAGRVTATPGAASVRAQLCVNGFAAMAAWAVPDGLDGPDGESRQFRFPTRDLWQFVKRADEVTVRIGDRVLPMPDGGSIHHVRRDGRQSLAVLQRRLAAGEVFTSKGQLTLSKRADFDWQAGVLGLYRRVRAIVSEQFGTEAFLIYGSLLGAVRENGFIGHDIDFDAGYVSRHSEGAEAGRELAEIGRALIDAGLFVESRTVVLHIFDPKHPADHIDLFHTFFDDEGVLCFPWGIAGTTPFRRSQWAGVEEVDFAGSLVAIPKNAPALLETIYGPSWQIPNPGFKWSQDRTEKAPQGRVPAAEAARVYWANHYAHEALLGPTPFGEVVRAVAELPRPVVDLGCGDGRDSVAFAAQGRPVLGVDYSEVGLRRAGRRVRRGPRDSRAAFVPLDLADAKAGAAAIHTFRGESGGGAVLFYARFLLHAITPETRRALFDALAASGHDGDVFTAEFRVTEDEELPKENKRPVRHYVDADQVDAELRRSGFVVTSREAGTDRAPYGEENPFVARITARRGAVR